jgi:hypothetical protein
MAKVNKTDKKALIRAFILFVQEANILKLKKLLC